jgi:trimethylamine--corrinoid protein Co-methyltransferase
MQEGFTRNFPVVKVLTEGQVEAVHRGTLDVLANVGVVFHHDRALKLLDESGCKVDLEAKRVRFPPGLVEECLRLCPSSYRITARNAENDIVLGGNTVYFASYPGMEIVSLDTWEPRTASRKEQHDAVRVLDALPNLHLLWNSPYFSFKDVPPVMAFAEVHAAGIRCCAKAMLQGGPSGNGPFVVRMSQAVGMDVYCSFVSAPPLTLYEDQVDFLFSGAEAGMPLIPGTGANFGGTTPATLAGSLVSVNAEIMAQIVLIQLIQPRTRVGVLSLSFPQDMRSGAPAFGDIGQSLHQMAFNQMWRSYGIPPTNTDAALSSSKKIDFQDGYERSMSALLSALSGANLICLHGCIHGELSYHPLQSVLDDDIAGMIGRLLEGIEVSSETVALDVIHDVGPIPGCFLTTPHTRKWWRGEQYVPMSADRRTFAEWLATGKRDCLDIAKDNLEGILTTHKVDPPLTPSEEQAIEDVLEEARHYYREKGLISDEEWAAYRAARESPGYPYQ